MLIEANQKISGFWYKNEFFDIAGTIKEIKAKNKNHTAIILKTDTIDIITWVTKVVHV